MSSVSTHFSHNADNAGAYAQSTVFMRVYADNCGLYAIISAYANVFRTHILDRSSGAHRESRDWARLK